jgi:toxin-antitoxin system PIN domain toxin
MILPDINLLVYAYNADAPRHRKAKAWWEGVMNDGSVVGIPWAVACGYIRLMTHPRVLERPLPPAEAVGHVREWLARPATEVLVPGNRHLDILGRLLDEVGVAGSLTTDAHLAAMAIEHQCVLNSNDTDFSRFSGLRWVDPLA